MKDKSYAVCQMGSDALGARIAGLFGEAPRGSQITHSDVLPVRDLRSISTNSEFDDVMSKSALITGLDILAEKNSDYPTLRACRLVRRSLTESANEQVKRSALRQILAQLEQVNLGGTITATMIGGLAEIAPTKL